MTMFNARTNSATSASASILKRGTHHALCPLGTDPGLSTAQRRLTQPQLVTKQKRISQTSLGASRSRVSLSPRQRRKSHLSVIPRQKRMSQALNTPRQKRISQVSANSRRVRISQISISSSQIALSQTAQVPKRKVKKKKTVSFGCHRSQRSSVSTNSTFRFSGGRISKSRRKSQRWSTSSDYHYFQNIHEWKKASNPGSKDDLHAKGRSTKINVRILFFFIMNSFFIMCGAFIFMKLEAPAHEKKKLQWLTEFQEKFAPRNMSTKKIEKLRKYFEMKCHLSSKSWNYQHSVHYTYSIITTIGFGEITPATRLGKLVTLLYSLFGIILFIMFMAVFRVFLIAALNKIMAFLRFFCCKYCNPRNRRRSKMMLTLFLMLFLWTGITILFTAYSIEKPYHENIGWFANMYNIFVALTTIGFGDEVFLDRLDSQHIGLQMSFILSTIIILLLFSTLFEQIKQSNVETVSKRISHLVNSINQKHSKYMFVGPMLSSPAREIVVPYEVDEYNSESDELPTINEISPSETPVLNDINRASAPTELDPLSFMVDMSLTSSEGSSSSNSNSGSTASIFSLYDVSDFEEHFSNNEELTDFSYKTAECESLNNGTLTLSESLIYKHDDEIKMCDLEKLIN